MSQLESKKDSAGGTSPLDLQGYLEMTRLYYGRVYYAALAMVRDRDMAEDIAQETFLRAWLKRDSVRDSATQLQPWLFRISQNLAIQWLRQGQRRSQLMPIISMEDVTVDPTDTASKNPHDEAADSERSSQLTSAIMNLPDDLRQAILLHYGEGLTPADIARLNGESRSTVTRRLDKAHKLLKDYMEQGLAEGLAFLKPGKSGLTRTLLALGSLNLLPSLSQARLLEMAANTPTPPALETISLAAGTSKGIKSAGGFLLKLNGFNTTIIGSLFLVGLASYLMTSRFKEYHYWQDRISTTIGGIRGTDVKALVTPNENSDSGSKRKTASRRIRGLAGSTETPVSSIPKSPSAYGPLPETDRLVDVHGKVVDAGGNPIRGARVKGVTRAGMVFNKLKQAGEVITMSDGSFSLKQIPAGSLGLHVKSPHHATIVEGIEAPATDLVVTVHSIGASFSGIVINNETGAPVANTTVTLQLGRSTFPIDPPVMITGPDGRFQFDNVPAGEYFLDAKVQGLGMMADKPGWFSTSPVKTYNLADGESIEDVKIQMYKGHTVSGVVREASTGKPLAGVAINQQNSDSTSIQEPVVTDATGRYRMDNVVGASGFLVWISLQRSGYIHRPETQRGDENSPMFELGKNKEITRNFIMEPAIPVSGILRNDAGQPIHDALIITNADCMDSQPPFARTDAAGHYEVVLPANCNALLTFSGKGLPAVRQNIKVDNEPVNQDVVMPSGHTIGGVVLDANDLPLEGAAVEAFKPADRYGNTTLGGPIRIGQTISDRNGRFAIGGLPREVITLVGKKNDFADSSAIVELNDSAIVDTAVITLTGGKDIYGIVTTVDGEPVSGAQVELYSSEIHSKRILTKSQADGTFWFHSLPDRAMRIQAEHAQYGKVVSKHAVQPGGDDVELILGGPDSPRTLEVKIVDSSTGEPVQDFEILKSVGMSPVKGPQPGTFFQSAVTPGQNVSYVIKAPGYTFLKTDTIKAPDYQSSPVLTLSMGQGGSISGQVIAPEGTTVSVSGLMVKVESPVDKLPDFETMTDGSGRFSLKKLPVGNSTLSIKAPGSGSLKQEIQITEGRVLDLGTLQLNTGARVFGTVSKSDGAPLEGVEVEIGELNQLPEKIRTDANGRYEFSDLGRLSYWLRIPKYNISEYIRIDSGTEMPARNYSIGSAVIKGRVLQNGSPVSDVLVSAHDGTSSRQDRADAAGRFTIEGLPGRQYGLTARSITRVGRAGIAIDDGQTTEVTIELDSGTMVGRLLDIHGKPIAGAHILMSNHLRHPGLTSGYGATTKDDGQFEWQELPAGAYDVSAYIDGQLITSVQTVLLPPNGTTSDLELRVPKQTGGIDISIRNTDGTPALDAKVQVWIPLGGIHEFKEKIDKNGLLALRGIPPGAYKVSITPSGSKKAFIHEVEINGTAIKKIEQDMP